MLRSRIRKTIRKALKFYKSKEEVFNYLIIGVLTTLVNLIAKTILLNTFFDAKIPKELQISIIISWIIAVLFAYITNRIIVFKSKNKNIIKELVDFISARIVTLVFEMIYMWFFVTFLELNTKIYVAIWTLSCQISVIVLNYIFSKLFVFKKGKNLGSLSNSVGKK